MRNLLSFLWRIRVFLLFLFLETIAGFLIVRNNVFHRSVYFSSSNRIIGGVLEIRGNILEYLSLKEVNQQLAEENAVLRSMLISSYIITDKQEFTINDTLFRQQYQFINAQVINYTTSRSQNYITINKGRLMGIQEGMGVFSPSGVVGVVKNVTDNYATLMSVLHPAVRISVRLQKSGTIGTEVWDGDNFGFVKLLDIPLHVKVNQGDTVVTSSFSSIFPAGIPVGYVSSIEMDERKTFYNITLKLATDFSSLTHVYVVKNLIKPELDELENMNNSENE